MEKSEIFAIGFGFFGVLWGVVSALSARYANRQEKDFDDLQKEQKFLYDALISTQKEFTNATNKLSSAVDKLIGAVDHLEHQTQERHQSLAARVTDNHEAVELLRARTHWLMNKLTVIKITLEKDGHNFVSDDWRQQD